MAEKHKRGMLLQSARRMAACVGLLVDRFLPDGTSFTGGHKMHIASELADVMTQLDASTRYGDLYEFQVHQAPQWMKSLIHQEKVEDLTTPEAIATFFDKIRAVAGLLLARERDWQVLFCLDRLWEMTYSMLHFFSEERVNKDLFSQRYGEWIKSSGDSIKAAHKAFKYRRPLKYSSWFAHTEN